MEIRHASRARYVVDSVWAVLSHGDMLQRDHSKASYVYEEVQVSKKELLGKR